MRHSVKDTYSHQIAAVLVGMMTAAHAAAPDAAAPTTMDTPALPVREQAAAARPPVSVDEPSPIVPESPVREDDPDFIPEEFLSPTNLTAFTLPQVLSAALTVAPDLEAVRAKLNAATRSIAVQRSAYWPSIGVGASIGEGYGNSGDVGTPTSIGVGVNASWLMFDGFRREFSVLQARHNRRSIACSADEARRFVHRIVAGAYFGALLAQERMDTIRKDIAFNDRMLKLMQKRYATGTASRSDVLNFQIKKSSDADELLSQRQLLAANLAALRALADATLDLTPETAYLLNPYTTPIENVSVDIAHEIAHARANRGDLREQVARIASADAGVGAAHSDLLPNVSLGADYAFSRQNGEETESSDEASSFVGVTLSWNIFDGGRTHNAIGEQRAMLCSERAEYDKRVLELRSELRQYHQILKHARLRVLNGEQAMRYATQDRNLVTRLYEGGLVAVTRLNEVQKDFSHASERLVAARTQFWQTWEDLKLAAGHVRPEALPPSASDERVRLACEAFLIPSQGQPAPRTATTKGERI